MEASDNFPQDVVELLHYLDAPDAKAPIRACPGEGSQVPVWILGSSLYGAQLAAYLGLPYAFASHFAPAQLAEAADIYRTTFRPSIWRQTPYFMMAIGLCAASEPLPLAPDTVFQDEHGIPLGSAVTISAETFGQEPTEGVLLAATRP